MGGPIKEGIMHGIREPYRGGQLVRPGSGRPGYAGPGDINPQAWHKQPLQKIANTTQKIAQETAKKAKMFKGIFSKGIPSDVQVWKGIKNLAGRVGQWRLPSLGVTNPLTFGLPAALTAKYKYAQPEQVEKEYGISRMEKLLASSLPGGDQSYLPLALRGVFGERKIEVPEDRLKNITIEKGVPGGGDPKMMGTGDFFRKEKAKADKDTRVNKLLEMMGHKKSKKDAVYDALIDASQIIGAAPGGKGLNISKDIIQPVIGATSKRFDKPKEIEEAVRLMMVKGEIEKDIFKSKGTSSEQAIDALSAASGKSRKYVAQKQLGIANTPSEAKAQLAKLKNTRITSDNLTAVIQQYADENNIPFKKQITTDQKNEVVGKGKKYASIVDMVTDMKLDVDGADDGLYVVGTSIIQVEGGIPKLRG